MHVMGWIGWGMLALGGFGLLTSTVFLSMVLVGAARFRREARVQETALRGRPEFLPAVTLFNPLPGADAGLEGNVGGVYEQDYLRRAVAPGGSPHVEGAAGRPVSPRDG